MRTGILAHSFSSAFAIYKAVQDLPGQEVFIPKTWSAGDEFGRSGNAGRGPGGPARGRSDGPRGPRPDGRADNRGNRA